MDAFDPNEVGVLGWWHVLFFGVFIPFAVVRSKKRVAAFPKLPDRMRYLPRVIVQQLLFAAVSIYVAREEWIELFPRWTPNARDVAAGVVVLAAMIAYMAPRWKRNVAMRVKRLWLFMPRTPIERVLWSLVALCAGIGEEIVYRGVMFTIVTRLTGSQLVAAATCVASFSVAHWVQGRSSVIAIAGFSAAFHALVGFTGSLYVAMAVHTIYDLAAGHMYGYWGEKLGYPRTAEELAALPADAPFAPK